MQAYFMKSFLKQFAIAVPWATAIFLVFVIGILVLGYGYEKWSEYDAHTMKEISDGSCNIAVVPIMGEIIPYRDADYGGNGNEPTPSTNPDTVLGILQTAETDENIKGVLLRIDSGGGTPAASETISNAVKRSALPTVALIREIGTSGAYLVATGADTIIASNFSDIGSIGVNLSYVDNTAKNTKEGLRYISLVSAPFKDYGSPDKTLTYAEHALIERDLKIYHEQFVKEVAENRNLPIEHVAELADGSSMPGALALEKGLIDALGDQETARAWFAEQLKMAPEEVVFCE